ncbi:MAG TPA: hypothetical protein VMR52_01550 [Dehalococcoidia bacterium]|nr:hypothetical protein [Dehalococcoidia bacterium]
MTPARGPALIPNRASRIHCRSICAALKTYGMFVADNGSYGYLSGAPDSR